MGVHVSERIDDVMKVLPVVESDMLIEDVDK